MNSPDDDKTRISIKSSDNDAVTRIAPVTNATEDKTRIAPVNAADNDATVIKAQPATDDSTVTPSTDRVEKTRIAPSSKTAEILTAEPFDRIIADVDNHHGVLKERFVLEEVLGAGGMGVVYKARDLLKVEARDRDPYVAIKVLGEDFKAHPEAFISLQRESRKSQRIAHPNIVSVFDFDRDGDTVFMTMEYMEGFPLDKLIQQYKSTGLPTDDAWQIIKGMCAAMVHAHAEKTIHSDFKPGNIFVTGRGLAKVFDFGIARAVAQVDHAGSTHEDKTVFDAGNLGALTPAYASKEMLEGEVPDVRDDIYALGCVIYEIFTGEHPFNKTPANEAEAAGLKPKRIASLSKRQWRAIEKALAFKREGRIESVEDLYEELTVKYTPSYKLATALALVLSVMITVYFMMFSQGTNGFSESDMRNELEYQITLDLHKSTIAKLLDNKLFSLVWESDLWAGIQSVRKMVDKDDDWLILTEATIYSNYVEKINSSLKSKAYNRLTEIIDNAYRYTRDNSFLDRQKTQLAELIKQEEISKRQLAVTRTKDLEISEKNKQEKKKVTDLFDLALQNVAKQLECQGNLNMRNLSTAINKLRELDSSRYNKIENKLINSLAACISHEGESFPERAIEDQKLAIRLFNSSPVLVNLKIKPKDPCDESIAGLGARGKRTQCQDKIAGIGNGPALVVIPAAKGQQVFAIGKYEVSIGELNFFCKENNLCSDLKSVDVSLPATNVSLTIVKEYLKWLSKKTDQKYRLPAKHEWVYAAKSKREDKDPNRNCKLSSRGIQKGGDLVTATTGRQNGWGLVNYAGNAEEWVYDKGRTLIAVGGSYESSMDNCDINTAVKHNGEADKLTGFRVLRELKR